MRRPEIFPHQSEHLDISETIPASHACSGHYANRPGWPVGIGFERPSQVGTFRSYPLLYEIELFHPDSSGESARTHSKVLIVIVSSDIPIAILISGIGIGIGIVIDELLTVLAEPLKIPSTVHTAIRPHRHSVSARTIIETASVISEGSAASVISETGK